MSSAHKLAIAMVLLVMGGAANASPGSEAQDQRAQAASIRARINAHADQSAVLASIARASRDSFKLGCVESGLLVSRQLSSNSNEDYAALERAIRAGDRTEQTLRYARIASAAAESDATYRRTSACRGSHELRVSAADLADPSDTTEQKLPTPRPRPRLTGCNGLGVAGCQNDPPNFLVISTTFASNPSPAP